MRLKLFLALWLFSLASAQKVFTPTTLYNFQAPAYVDISHDGTEMAAILQNKLLLLEGEDLAFNALKQQIDTTDMPIEVEYSSSDQHLFVIEIDFPTACRASLYLRNSSGLLNDSFSTSNPDTCYSGTFIQEENLALLGVGNDVLVYEVNLTSKNFTQVKRIPMPSPAYSLKFYGGDKFAALTFVNGNLSLVTRSIDTNEGSMVASAIVRSPFSLRMNDGLGFVAFPFNQTLVKVYSVDGLTLNEVNSFVVDVGQIGYVSISEDGSVAMVSGSEHTQISGIHTQTFTSKVGGSTGHLIGADNNHFYLTTPAG